MLGVNFNLKETLYSALAGAKEEALGRLPLYNYLATEFRRYQAKQRLQGPKTATNTVDEYEYNKAVKHITAEIHGTLNPFRWVWGFIQTIFGNTHTERVVASIKNLENYAIQHDAYKFVNDAQRFLFETIEKRIPAVENLSSKILGTKNTKVTNDPVLTALKSALQAWLEPFDKIINGEVAEVPKPSEGDIKLLAEIRDFIRYSPKTRYIEDMLPKYDQIIVEGKRALYSDRSAAPRQPRAHNRKVGQHLAKTAA